MPLSTCRFWAHKDLESDFIDNFSIMCVQGLLNDGNLDELFKLSMDKSNLDMQTPCSECRCPTWTRKLPVEGKWKCARIVPAEGEHPFWKWGRNFHAFKGNLFTYCATSDCVGSHALQTHWKSHPTVVTWVKDFASSTFRSSISIELSVPFAKSLTPILQRGHGSCMRLSNKG